MTVMHYWGMESMIDHGRSVSIADVYFANGSDNTLMNLLLKEDLLYKVSAYNGWNTASNTIGFAIAQAILAPEMNPAAHKSMLLEQYIDNWAYQANVRKKIKRFADIRKTHGKVNQEILEEMIAELQDFAKNKMNLNPQTISANFPWDRFFEIEALVSETPKYNLHLTEAARNERLASAQKKTEEAKKSNKDD